MTVGLFTEPLLGASHGDVERGLPNGEKALPQKWAEDRLHGIAPLIPQLPTDALGPALQHQWPEVASIRGVEVPAEIADRLSALPGGLEAAAATAWSALLGRYARAGEVALSLWRPHPSGWAAFKVDLLLPMNERTGEDGEDSAVIPGSAFACARQVAARVTASLAALDASEGLLTPSQLQALDASLASAAGGAAGAGEDKEQQAILRALEGALVFGRGPSGEAARHPLSLVMPRWPRPAGKPLALEMRFARGFFGEEAVARVLRHVAALLEQLPARWGEPLCELDLQLAPGRGPKAFASGLNMAEVADLQAWGDAYGSSCYCRTNPTCEHWSADRPITSLFDECVRATPDAVAMIDDGTGRTFTYKELSVAADKVAYALTSFGVGPDTLVPLMAPRSASMIFGMFGILRAGGAYVPMDLHWPDDRLRDVLEQCGAKVLLGATPAVCSRLASLGASAQVLSIESLVDADEASPTSGHYQNAVDSDESTGESAGDEMKVTSVIKTKNCCANRASKSHQCDKLANGAATSPVTGSNLVYVFFTSGTTGKPKGVMVEHRGLSHRIHWFQQQWPLSPGEGVMQKVAYTFGLSEWEIFWPLSFGATLLLAPPGGEKDPDYVLRRACGAYRMPDSGLPAVEVSLAAHVFVPSMLQMVLERFDELEEQEAQRKPGQESPEGTWWRAAPVRQVITCGEPLTAALSQRMFSRFTGAGLVNLYGPTEGEMSAWDAPRGEALARVPAGAPMAGSKVILADLRSRKVAAALEPAEIAFGGPFIARGYLGRPDLDAKAFVPDFSCTAEEASEGHRLYLTGDLGRWREGQVELLGRRDFQVKLRGFRIELGEIESAVRAAGARAAVCVVRPGAGGAPALVAYYEPGAEGKVSEALVRASCQKRLPPYMQPQAVVQLEKLPRNANGKVDRPKLPEPPQDATAAADADDGAVLSPPETPTEVGIAEAWAEVLGLDVAKVSAEADFQELGGSSLLAGRATALIRKRLGAPGLAGTAIYKHPTVRRLAVLVDAARAEQEAADADATESGKVGCQALAPACQPETSELRSDSPMALFIQFVGVFCLNFIFESQAWSPIWWEAWFLYRDYGTWALLAYLPVAVVGDMLMQVFLLSALKWIIVGKLKPGKYKLWSGAYYRWWFVDQLMHHISGEVFPLIAETPLANAFLRLNGAKIGRGVRISVSDITEPDLLVCGDDVTIGKRARISTSAVMHGHLHLGTVCLGDGSAVGPCAVLSQQTEVPAGRAVLPLSTMPGWHGPVGAVAHQPATRACSPEFQRRQDMLRAVFGVPIVAFTHCVPYIPTIFILQWFWAWCADFFGDQAFTVFSIALAWVYVHPIWMSFLAFICLQKWLVVGPFKPGHQEWSHWAEFRHWLHARAVESHDFEEICEMWVNTEVLSMIYRLMGARVGRRVQIDAFHAVEHDLLTIEDYTVFGSEVSLSCDSRAPWTPQASSCSGGPLGYEHIRLGKASNVLDHCMLLPGATVAERAVLGTCTLAPHRAYFPPLAIHSGCSRGRSLHLRDHSAPKALRALEDKAMQALDNPVVWWRFNAIIFFITALAKPIPEALWVVTYFGVTALWDPEEDSVFSLLCFVPVVYWIVCMIELFATIAAKWLIIGRYKAGDFPFFGQYHVRWMTMMILSSGISALSEALQGTIFNAWVYRANGARVGRNCYLAGLAVEYDLLQIGDNVAIGPECDTTGHTVENMVIKLAATKLGNGVAMCPASFAMPGSVIEDDAVLLEHTQVLKGETVPCGEVWAGMPAARCQPRPPATSL